MFAHSFTTFSSSIVVFMRFTSLCHLTLKTCQPSLFTRSVLHSIFFITSRAFYYYITLIFFFNPLRKNLCTIIFVCFILEVRSKYKSCMSVLSRRTYDRNREAELVTRVCYSSTHGIRHKRRSHWTFQSCLFLMGQVKHTCLLVFCYDGYQASPLPSVFALNWLIYNVHCTVVDVPNIAQLPKK